MDQRQILYLQTTVRRIIDLCDHLFSVVDIFVWYSLHTLSW